MKRKIALVTGASGHIGQEICKELSCDYLVIATVRSLAKAQKLHDFLREYTENFALVELELTDSTAVQRSIKDMLHQYGRIDVLVNNAAICSDSFFALMSDKQWHRVLDSNLNSTFYVSRTVAKSMIKHRFGRIISIGSVVARRGNRGQVNYAATKAALEGLSKSLALELAARNITVNVVAPGLIEGGMSDTLSDGERQAMLATIPLKRFGKANEVAQLVKFLASEQAAYITGQVIAINGGLY